MSKFDEGWIELERRFIKQAEKDEGVYLPNPKPSGRVDHVLIAMEPSLSFAPGGDPKCAINSGQRNFLYTMEDFLLHYAIREYLCATGEKYHVTDVCKAAMRVKEAQKGRDERYEPWYPLLKDEIDVVAKRGASIWAIRLTLRKYLKCLGLREERFVLHCGAQAGAARWAEIGGPDNKEFQDWKRAGKVSLDHVLTVAKAVLDEYDVPERLKSDTLDRLWKTKELSLSRLALLFHYRTKFLGSEGARGLSVSGA